MKKKILFLVCVLFALSAWAYIKNSGASLQPGVYTLQNVKRDVPGDFTISIYDDGSFQSYETPISSYIGMGSYEIKGDIVILKEDKAGCTGNVNRFQIADGRLLFRNDGSANYAFVPLKDKAAFVRTGDVP